MSALDRPAEILLVEDDSGDVLLLREAFKGCRRAHRFHVAGDGEQAMSYVEKAGKPGGGPWPDLILLDLNMPRKDGREVLAELKASPQFRRIPVVVLTTSDSDTDVRMAYQLHANSYVVKPLGLDGYTAVAKRIEDFWLGTARLPNP